MTPQIDNPHHDNRWLILGVIAIAQLMIVLDLTIVNIALPSAQHALGFSDNARQWVITAYALSFGSLLLLGGRLGDLFGRKWMFIGGLIGFAAASAVGGAAPSFAVLVAARAVQGIFAALLAPSALALLSTSFTDPAERGTAFGIFSAIGGGGTAVGLLLGGVLTQAVSWRWCLYINLAFAIPAAIVAVRLLVSELQRDRPALDLPGTLSISGAVFALVYGFSNSASSSWSDPVTIAMLAASVVLLGAFVAIEARAAHPLLPLRVLADRTRAGAYSALGITGIATFAVYLFLTYFLQQTKGYSPIQTGLAFMPLSAAIIITATSANIVLLQRVGARVLMSLGMALGAGAMVWFAQLTPTSSYAGHVLPASVILGVGVACVFAPAFFSATSGVAPRDTGVASGMANTAQQVGGSIGTSLMSSIFASAVTSYLAGKPHTPQVIGAAAVHGYTVGFWVAAGIFVLGAVLVAAMMRSVKAQQQDTRAASAQFREQVAVAEAEDLVA